MKYAKLLKLQGELIAAENADYQDYFGFLVCDVCGEPVFLRKAHTRGNEVSKRGHSQEIIFEPSAQFWG